MHSRRHCVQFRLGMKSRLIPNHDVFRAGITRRQVLQKQAAHLQTHFRQAQKLRRIFPVHCQRRVKVAPFIFRPIRPGRPQAPQRPTLAHHRDQTITMFIGHPHPHRLSTSHVQARQPFAERVLEHCDGRRVFLRVGLARHFQDPAQFSQPVIHAGQLEPNPMLLSQPVLNFLGTLPAARLQAGQQFLEGWALHLRAGPAAMLTLQQAGQTAGLEGVHPGEKPPAADAQLLGDLFRGELSARRSPCSQ